MAEMEKSIVVDAPPGAVYQQWTQFQDFPRFMDGVLEVRPLDDRRLFWRAQVGSAEREWVAEIVDQVPERRIAWRSLSEVEHTGAVLFEALADQRTRVTLRMRYDPEGLGENLGDALGFVGRQVQGDLERFREFMEARAGRGGAWRGEADGKHIRRETKDR